MTLPIAVALVLWLGVTLYAVFGGADFGSGVWDLTAGRAEHGARARALVDLSIGSVWEANHVWLIFCLVVLWTAFSPAFAAIMTSLFIPLTLAAFGIVLRGSGFAFRKVTTSFRARRAYGVVFASSSVVTPFFMGVVAGAIASGRVTTDTTDSTDVWVSPTSVLGGALAVAACAFLAATFLVHEAERRGDRALARQFARRGMVAGAVCGVLAIVGVAVLHADAPYLFDRLTHEALPLMIASGVCGVGALVLLARGRSVWARAAAVGAVATVIWGWGAAQYPYLLPETLTIDDAASSDATLWMVIGVLVAAGVLVVPPLVWLLRLTERRDLEGAEGLDTLAAENVPAT